MPGATSLIISCPPPRTLLKSYFTSQSDGLEMDAMGRHPLAPPPTPICTTVQETLGKGSLEFCKLINFKNIQKLYVCQ